MSNYKLIQPKVDFDCVVVHLALTYIMKSKSEPELKDC